MDYCASGSNQARSNISSGVFVSGKTERSDEDEHKGNDTAVLSLAGYETGQVMRKLSYCVVSMLAQPTLEHELASPAHTHE